MHFSLYHYYHYCFLLFLVIDVGPATVFCSSFYIIFIMNFDIIINVVVELLQLLFY